MSGAVFLMGAVAIPRWAEPYIGVPFVERGFSRAGCHCWGLVCLVFAAERGVALPRHAEVGAGDIRPIARAITTEVATGPWSPVAGARQAFDVALMREVGGERLPLHVGVMISPSHLLHVERASAAVAVPLDHPTVRGRLAGAYRHRDLESLA